MRIDNMYVCVTGCMYVCVWGVAHLPNNDVMRVGYICVHALTDIHIIGCVVADKDTPGVCTTRCPGCARCLYLAGPIG